ncbi:hypothetical protein ACSVDM_00985 [Nocardia sp. JW2]|uniref:hypothetical protein n=1 Tax=Nocardia sp. JW2 TaxID=3450738 RepID=UPI003F438E34
MSDGPEFFPIAIGSYIDHDDLDVDTELGAVTAVLEPFNVRVQDWNVAMTERGAGNVETRISRWRRAQHPATILYWVGHGWTNNAETAVLYHANSEQDSGDVGVTPTDLAKAIAGRLHADDRWAIVVVDACGSKRFIELLKTALLDKRVVGRYLLVGGLSGEGATSLGRFSRDLDHLLNVTFRGEFEIELGKLADEFERLSATVERKRLVDLVLRRRHAVIVNSPLDVTAELEAALSELSDDELRHFLPKAHGGELPFKETVLGEQSWYFEGRQSEIHQIVDWLATVGQGMLVVTGPAGSGKSALLGHLVVHSNPTLRTALVTAGVLEEVPEDERPPDAVFDLVLHLTGASPEVIVSRIAEGIGAGGPPLGSVSEATRWLCDQLSDRTTTILVDALDEAVDPLTAAQMVLRELAGVPTVRLLIGTRLSTHEGPDLPASDTNLFDALGPTATRLHIDRDDTAIERYVVRRLHRVDNSLVPSFDVTAFARTVRAQRRQFLFARLAVHEVLADRRWQFPSEWENLLGQGHQHLFEIAVERLAALHPNHRPLLRALAFARGRGIPDQGGLWVVLARALAPGQHIGSEDVQRLVRDAAPYLLADREYGQTVYRLAHRTFAEYFKGNAATAIGGHRVGDEVTVQASISKALRDQLPSPGVPPHPYIRRELITHAAQGDVLDDIHIPASFLPWESSGLVRSHIGIPARPEHAATVLAAWAGLEPLVAEFDPQSRGLSLDIAVTSAEPRPAASTSDSLVQPLWSRWHVRKNILAHAGSAIHALAVVPLPDGRTLLATGGGDGAVRLWDPLTGLQVGRSLTGHTGGVRTVAVVALPNEQTLLASGGSDGDVRLWDPISGRQVGQPLAGHTGWVSAIAVVTLPNDQTLLATGGDDRSVRLWNPMTGYEVGQPMTGHAGGVRAIAVVTLPGGRTLLVTGGDGGDLADGGNSDGDLRLWDPVIGDQVGQPMTGHSGWVSAIAAVTLPDGRTLLASTGGSDGTVRLWDPMSGQQVGQPLTGHANGVYAIAVVILPDDRTLLATGSEQGTLLATGGDGRTVRLWDPVTGHQVGQPMTGHSGWVSAVAVVTSTDGRTLLASAGGSDGTIRLWDPMSGLVVEPPPVGHIGGVSAVAVVALPDGRTLLASGGESGGAVRLWHSDTGHQVGHPLTGHTHWVRAIAVLTVANEVSLLATGAGDGTVRLWDPVTGHQVGEPLTGHTGSVRAIAIVTLPDERTLLATGGSDGTVRLWDPVTGHQVGEPLTGHASPVYAIAVVTLPDERTLLATGGGDFGAVRLWDPVTGHQVGQPLIGLNGWVYAIAVVNLPDGRTLLATGGGSDGAVRLWDPVTGHQVGQPLIGHNGWVYAIAVVNLPDGRTLLATGGNDGSVRLWDLMTYRVVRVGVLGTPVTALAVIAPTSMSATRLIVAGEGGLLLLEFK